MYKRGQGYWTRMCTAVSAGLIVTLGASWLWEIVSTSVRIGDIQPIYIAAGTALLVCAVFGSLVYYYVGVKPATVEFLIATEGEMKKVNWSTRREIFGSTWVVLAVVFLITMLVFMFDSVFFLFFAWIKVLDAGAGSA